MEPSPRDQSAKVVIAQAAADGEHAGAAQRRQGTSGGEVLLRVRTLLQRQLHDRHARFGIHHLHWREHAAVEAADGILADRSGPHSKAASYTIVVRALKLNDLAVQNEELHVTANGGAEIR